MARQRLIADLRTALSRIAEPLLRRRRDRRLAEEIAGHLDELKATYEAQGMTPSAARDAARRAFGGVDQVRFDHREQRGLPALDSVAQDVLFAVRLLAKDRWNALAGALALALGIAVSTTVFTLINGITLQELPVDEPDRVVHLVTGSPRGRAETAYPDLADWQLSARSFEGLAGYVNTPVTVGDGERAAEQLANAYVSWNAFDILHERPIVGRGFTADDDRLGVSPVAVLAHHIWTARFAADPGVVGQTIRIDGAPVTVVGVMRAGLRFPIETDLWQPLSAFPRLNRQDRQLRNIGSFGRLADGATLAHANAEMTAISSALAAQHPSSNRDTRVEVMPFTERYSGRITETPPLMMLCAVGIILLIACANAAMLLLARAAPRAREVALRAALGASRRRILRQLLIESLLLSTIAGGLGLVFSMMTIRLVRDDLTDLNLPYWMQFVFDWRVFTFVAAICLTTALGSGLAPAWHLSRTRAAELLKDGGRGITGGARSRRWSSALLIAELALTLTLLAGAGLLTRSAAALEDADRIVKADSLLSARLAMPAARYSTVDARRRFLERLEAQLALQPATREAGLTTILPFMGGPSRPVEIESAMSTERPPTAHVLAISDGYLAALGLPMLHGRGFTAADSTNSVIVNQRFVDQFASDRDPIGRQIRIGDSAAAPDLDRRWLTIVGVAPSFRQSPMRDALPALFVPIRAQPGAGIVAVVVPNGDRPGVAALLTEAVRAADPDVAVFRAMPLQRLSELSRFNHRLMSLVLTAIAAVAMLLSAIGLYGVTAFGVTQRTAEIGIRMALGGARAQLMWLLVRRTLARVAVGVVLGLAGAIAIGQLLGGLLINTSPLDPTTLATVVAVLGSVATAACLIPARRALRLDPVAALRRE
jgi:putative ABC transport system permease protein